MLVAATILVVTLVLIHDLYQASENEVTDRFREHQTLTVRHLAQEIEQCLRDRSRGVQVLSGFASIQHRDTEMMTADIQEYFKYLKNNHVKAISVYDAKGTIICSTTEEATGQNNSNSDFFQWARRKENKGKLLISSLMPARQMSGWRAEENQTDLPPCFRFLIVTPVYQEALDPRYRTPSLEFVGVLTFAIDLEEVVAAALPAVSSDSTKERVWIMDTSGTVLFQLEHPDMVLRNIHRRDETCLQCHVSFDYVEKVIAEKQGTVEYALREQPNKLAAFAPLRYENASWIIVVNDPLDAISGFLQKQKARTILLIGAMLIVMVGAFVLFYRSNRLKIRVQEEAKQWREKRELENRIRESEERFKQVAESAEEWIWETDAQGLYTYSSSAVQTILGYHPEEIVGKKHFHDLFAPDVQDESRQAAFATFARKDLIRGLINPNVHKNGSTVILETSGVPILDQRGDLLGYRGAGTDITARKRAEESLKLSVSLLQATLESTDDGILVVDKSGRITSYNKQFAKMWNLPADVVASRDDNRALNHVLGQLKYPEAFISKVRDLYAQPDKSSFEVLEFKDGRVFERYSQPQRVDGEAVGRVWSFRDVTARKKAEYEIRLLAQTLSSTKDCVSIADLEDKIIFVNSAFLQTYGFTREELLSQPVSIVRSAKTPSEIGSQIFAATLAGGWYGEIFNRRKDGSEFPVELWTSTVKDDTGKVVATVGVARDISVRKTSEQERESLINELKTALENVRTLSGLVPICAHCKKIRDDKGYWNQLEKYIVEHTDANLTHGICPDCAKLYFPGLVPKT
jgi:PAS domain S-box-containing protein